MYKPKKNGFTLIELITVVVIIGILAGVTINVINIKKVQQRSRDSRRIGDIKKIQTALELYFADTRSYPKNPNWVLASSLSIPNYIDAIPTDPSPTPSVPAGVSCFNGITNYGYRYISTDSGGKYVLGAIMETTENADDSLCSVLPNCTGSPPAIVCNSPGLYCYCVQNPM